MLKMTEEHCFDGNVLSSGLSNMVAASHIWLSSTRKLANMTEELITLTSTSAGGYHMGQCRCGHRP